jgi:hypothetical protein
MRNRYLLRVLDAVCLMMACPIWAVLAIVSPRSFIDLFKRLAEWYTAPAYLQSRRSPPDSPPVAPGRPLQLAEGRLPLEQPCEALITTSQWIN